MSAETVRAMLELLYRAELVLLIAMDSSFTTSSLLHLRVTTATQYSTVAVDGTEFGGLNSRAVGERWALLRLHLAQTDAELGVATYEICKVFFLF